jgi:hypothetical protein
MNTNSSRIWLIAIILSTVMISACTAGSNGPIRTDKQKYTLANGEIAISATYTNHGSDTVYLGYCGKTPPRFHVEKVTNGNWSTAYDPICLAILVTTPFPVPPGESHTDLLRLTHSETSEPRFQSSPVAGEYRLVYDIYSKWNSETGEGELLPVEQRISNTFSIAE